MAQLPNHERAEIGIAKLRDYCLSPTHLRGRHKARLFASALGISAADAVWLRDAILNELGNTEAAKDISDQFGPRWRVDVLLTRQNRRAVVRTVWLIPHGQSNAKLITAWVL